MPEGATSWAVLAAVILFILFVVLKSRVSLTGRRPVPAGARERFAEAKQRVRDARQDPQRRARALREAATVALEELRRPNLAASYALRAERADPADASAVGVLATALRRAHRYRALEKLLWRRLSAEGDGAGYERAFDELLSLYDGPLRRPAQAQVLRRLRERAERTV